MDLRNYEFSPSTGLPIVGAAVTVYDATLTHPPTTVVTSGVTNGDGMWSFTGLSNSAKDVKVVANGQTKWYKGMTRHGVTVVFYEEPLFFKQVATPSAPGADGSLLYFKSDGQPYFRSGAAGAETRIHNTGTSITTSDLAANAATRLVIGSTFSGSTSAGSGSPATLQNIAITTVGGDLEVNFSFFGWGTMLNVPCYIRVGLDGGSFETVAAQSQPIASGYFSLSGHKPFSGVAAGAHTVNIQWWTDNPGNTFVAAGGRPSVKELRR